MCVVKFPLPSFSCQAIVLSFIDADSTSMSPSPSMSAAYTDRAPFTEVATSCSMKLSPLSISRGSSISLIGLASGAGWCSRAAAARKRARACLPRIARYQRLSIFSAP